MGGPRRKADPPPCSAPLPLVGRGWGWGSGNGARSGRNPSTPQPDPPPQGGREKEPRRAQPAPRTGSRSAARSRQNRQHDQRVPRHHADHQQIPPAQAVAFAPYLVNKLGKKWHIVFADFAWGQSTRDAYADEIRKAGGEVVGATGIPLGTAEMTPFLSRISGSFDGLFGIFAAADGVTVANQAFDLGLTKKYRWAGDGAISEAINLLALGNKIEGFVGINRYLPVLEGPLNTPAHKRFLEDASVRLKKIDPTGPLPDRYVQSNYEAMNALKLGMEKSGFRGHEDTMKLIEALEGLEMKEGDDFPQGDKVLRKEDHQAFVREFIFEIKDGKHRIVETVEKEKTFFPPACKFAAA